MEETPQQEQEGETAATQLTSRCLTSLNVFIVRQCHFKYLNGLYSRIKYVYYNYITSYLFAQKLKYIQCLKLFHQAVITIKKNYNRYVYGIYLLFTLHHNITSYESSAQCDSLMWCHTCLYSILSSITPNKPCVAIIWSIHTIVFRYICKSKSLNSNYLY